MTAPEQKPDSRDRAAPEPPQERGAVDAVDAAAPAADDDGGARPRQSRHKSAAPSLSETMNAWAPVAAGVLRAAVGLVAFAASLLALPVHPATPFLTGVGLVMLVGGCVAVMKFCKDEPSLARFGRWFPIVCSLLVVGVFVVVAVEGVGAFAPELRSAPREGGGDGTVRFSAPEAG